MMERLRVARIIALSTFRQGLRGRLVFGLLAAVLSLSLLGLIFRGFGGKQNLELRLILETGTAISAFVVLTSAVLLSCRGLGEGSDRAGYLAMFSLPIDRDGVYWGYLAGVCITLLFYTAAMAASLSLVVYWRFSLWRWSLAVHFVTLFVEAVILAAIASTFALGGSSIVAFFATVAVAVLAHAEGVVTHLAHDSGQPLLDWSAWLMVKLLPCLAAIDIKASAVRDLPVDWPRLSWALLHSAVYLVLLLWLGSVVRRRLVDR